MGKVWMFTDANVAAVMDWIDFLTVALHQMDDYVSESVLEFCRF